jgi:hypothetical protein
MNSSKRFIPWFTVVCAAHVRACTYADSVFFLTVPVCLSVCVQTRTLGSDSRSRQSYPGRFWQFIDVHHRGARVYRLPVRCN